MLAPLSRHFLERVAVRYLTRLPRTPGLHPNSDPRQRVCQQLTGDHGVDVCPGHRTVKSPRAFELQLNRLFASGSFMASRVPLKHFSGEFRLYTLAPLEQQRVMNGLGY